MKNTNNIDIVERLNESVAQIKGKRVASTQKKMAEMMGINEVTFSRALKGNDKYLTDSFLENFSKTFGFDEEWLRLGKKKQYDEREGDVFMLNEQSAVYQIHNDARIINKDAQPEYFQTKAGMEYFIYPNNDTYIEVHKLRLKAYASYAQAFTDEGQFNLVDGSKTRFKVEKVGLGYYLGFETVNESMNGGGINDTPGGADVLGRELQRSHWNDGFNETKYGWILLTKNNIYHKDIKSYNIESGTIVLSSRDGITEDFEMSINDVYRIFKIIKRNF